MREAACVRQLFASAPSFNTIMFRMTVPAWCSDLLEQLQPFSAKAVLGNHETGGVAAWARQALDIAGGDRIVGDRKHDRHGAGRLQQRWNGRIASGQDDVWRERD